jgi:RsbT co-antagonist protein rsbRD N-terminal domain
MTINGPEKLAALVKQERHALLSRWRQQVRQLPSARQLDIPTLNDHIPGLLDELATALQSKSAQTIPEALLEASPPVHGLQRLENAFDIEEVVAEYNILRGCIHDLADDNGLNLQGNPPKSFSKKCSTREKPIRRTRVERDLVWQSARRLLRLTVGPWPSKARKGSARVPFFAAHQDECKRLKRSLTQTEAALLR